MITIRVTKSTLVIAVGAAEQAVTPPLQVEPDQWLAFTDKEVGLYSKDGQLLERRAIDLTGQLPEIME